MSSGNARPSATRRRGTRLATLASGAAAIVTLAACGSTGSASTAEAPGSAGASTRPSSSGLGGSPIPYQLHMDFFSHESHLSTVIDPQVFTAAPGSPAGTGPQMVQHAPGIAPAQKASAAATPLLAADSSPLHITLGDWEKAAGTASFSCQGGQERVTSQLTGLVPNGSYSVFVVHLDVKGPGRFTPWGNAQGTTNNFTAGPTGSASLTSTVQGCLNNRAAALVVWHSDGKPHGATPGTLGVTWHNSLITPLP